MKNKETEIMQLAKEQDNPLLTKQIVVRLTAADKLFLIAAEVVTGIKYSEFVRGLIKKNARQWATKDYGKEAVTKIDQIIKDAYDEVR